MQNYIRKDKIITNIIFYVVNSITFVKINYAFIYYMILQNRYYTNILT